MKDSLDGAEKAESVKTAEIVPDSYRLRGFLYCLAANFFYSLTFFLVRCLTSHIEINSDWTLFVKESTTVLITLLFIVVLIIRGRFRVPPLRYWIWLLLAGFFCEFFGARLNLWAYAMLGLVLAIPLIQIFTLLGTLLMGAAFLRERITPKKCLAVLVLIAALLLLSFSHTGMQPLLKRTDYNVLGWGILVTVIAGCGYTLFYVILRGVLKKKPDEKEEPVPLPLSMCLICFVGVVVAGICLLREEGAHAFLAPSRRCWLLALGSGCANCTAFFLQSLGLRYATASKVTLIAVVQIVCLTLIGAFFFKEPTNLFVWVGLTLTCAGILLARNLE